MQRVINVTNDLGQPVPLTVTGYAITDKTVTLTCDLVSADIDEQTAALVVKFDPREGKAE